MDENKEINTEAVSGENDSDAAEKTVPMTEEETPDAAGEAETVSTEAAATEATAFGEELAETGADAPLEAAAPPAQKKNLVMKPILIAAGIVLVVALAALVIRLFFNTSVEGTWRYVRQVPMRAANATDDEAVENVDVEYYFTFKGSDVTATIGTVTSKGTYTIEKNDEGKSVMNMDLTDLITSYNFLSYGEYELQVTGNIFTGRTLTLTTPSSESEVIEMKSASYSAPELTREGEFEVNNDLVGKWVFRQDSYNLSYDIKADGTIRYAENVTQLNMYTGANMTIDYSIDGIYSVSDSAITMQFYYTKDTSMDIAYSVDGDTLVLNGIAFTKEGAATASEAE